MAGLFEDVSGAQNQKKQLDNHKVLKNLRVIILPPAATPPPETRNSGPESQNILNKLIYPFT